MRKALSPAFFALVVVCFFLPFVSVSCNAEAIGEQFGELGEGAGGELDIPQGELEATATGWQIVTNSAPEPEGLEGLEEELGTAAADTPEEDFPGRLFAILALGAAVLGIGLSFLRGRLGAALATVLGAAGLLFLFLLRNSIQSEIGPAEAFGFFEVSYKYGFWLALALFGLAAIAGGWRLGTERPAAAAPPAPPAEGPPPPPEEPAPPPPGGPPGETPA